MRFGKTLWLLSAILIVAASAHAQVPKWPDGWPVVDQYGGITGVTVAGSNGQWRVAKVGNRWLMVDPLDHPVWLNGVWQVTECCNSIARYGSSLNWSVQTLKRLNRWGFTFIWDHSFGSTWPNAAGQTNPIPMPYFQDGNDYPTRPEKAVLPGYCTTGHTAKTLGGSVNPAYGPPGFINVGTDPYDPCFTIWNNAFWAPATRPAEATNAMASLYFPGWSSAESDFIKWASQGSGTDFISTPPGKEQDAIHGAWVVLAANPIVTSEQIPTGATVTFTDTQLYAKTALQTFLQGRYANIGALNTAWASTYTTFGSDGGWGNTGNGLMDENGNTSRHAWVGSWNTLAGETTAMKQDLNDFLFQLATKFFQVQSNAFKAAYPNKLYFGPNIVGSWGNPPRSPVLQAAAPYVDVLQMNIGTGAANDQARLDFVGQYFGDKPIVNWMGFPANPNSAICGTGGVCTNPNTWQAAPTQVQRGINYATLYFWQFNSALTSNGSHLIIGQRWWALADSAGEGTNWGLESYTKGNAYNAVESVTGAITDPWGFPAGGEAQNYGNFLGPGANTVINTNLSIMQMLAGIPSPLSLTVNSTSPSSGVAITVSPVDTGGASNGSTSFIRNYNLNTVVTLIAPVTAGGNNFSSWTGCDSVSGTGNRTCNVTLTASRTVVVNYTVPVTNTLTIGSVNPASGVAMAVSPADVNGATNGSTTVTRIYPQFTAVTITAAATSGLNSFASWTGCDSVSGLVCTKTMNANSTITATYASPATFILSVASTLPASGVAITVSPADVNSQSNGSTPFSRTYVGSTTVTLTAPLTAAGNNFSGWTGCDSVSGASNTVCMKTVTANSTVTANYTPPPAETLTIASANPASGVAMVVSPLDINGNSNGNTPVTRIYPQGTVVTITAPATSGANTFALWSGCDSVGGTGNRTCTKTMSTNATVTASYTSPATFTLNVLSTNPGSGVPITVSPADINGASNGTTAFGRTYVSTSVTLTAPLTSGINTFSGWTGCDSVSGPSNSTCTKLVNSNSSVTANYASPPTETLTVSSVNPGSGVAMVVSPADVNGASNGSTQLTRTYVQNTVVTVTAPNTSGANTFSSWAGCDTAIGLVCTKTMTGNATVTATYASPPTFTLNVTSTLPATSVPITVSPADVNGQSSGSAPFSRTYPTSTSVTLTAPLTAAGNNFSNWTGCNSVSGPSNSICTKVVTSNSTVTANFAAPVTENLSIASVNPASGVAMVVSPADVNGNSNGSTLLARVYPQGTVVTITAPASSGLNTFGLWTGCDSVSGRACTKTMVANATVTASYNSPATSVLNVLSTNPASAVAITASPADVNGATNGSTPFARTYIVPTTVTLVAPATVGGNTFSSWTGCDVVVVRTCTKNLGVNSSVTANYASPVTETLTIASLNPATGVAMTVSPADVNGATNGSTQFTRIYLQGATVSVTAPATSGANTFASWTGCDTAVTVACTKTMNVNATITANYTSPAIFALTVSSQQPISGIGVSVSPVDVNALGNGVTQFVRNYTGGTTVTLVAPSSAGGNAFLAWVGCDVAVGFTCTKVMNANGHVTAVYAVLGATGLWRGGITIRRGVILTHQ